MSQFLWPGALGLPQLPFKRLFTPVKRQVPSGAQIVTAYTDGQVTLRSNRAKIGYHEAADTSTYLGVNRGDFVVHGLDIMRGSVGVSDSDGAISPVCTVCVPTGLIEPRYAAYAMRVQAASDYPRALARGVREGGADFRRWDTLAELPLPVPQYEYQRKISDFLDRETAQIDAFIAKNEQLIALLTERRAAEITARVTGVQSGSSWVALRHLAEVLDCKHVTAEREDGVESLALASVREVGGQWVDLRGARRTSLESFRNLAEGARQLRPWDLLVCRNASVGKVSIFPPGQEPTVMGQDVSLIRTVGPDPDISRFLFYVLTSAVGVDAFERASIGSTFRRINVDDIKALRVPAVSPAEARSVADLLDAETKRVDAALVSARQAIVLANERRAALISAAVTGKIDVGVDA